MKQHWAMTNSRCVVCNGWASGSSILSHVFRFHLPVAVEAGGVIHVRCWCGKEVRSDTNLHDHLMAGITFDHMLSNDEHKAFLECRVNNHYLECLMGVENE